MNCIKFKNLFIIISVLTLLVFCQVSVFAGNLGDSVGINTTFQMNDYLTSQNGLYTAYWQTDGNFVVYNSSSQPLWSSNTVGIGARCRFEDRGNLVIRNDLDQQNVIVDISADGSWIQDQIFNTYPSENLNTKKVRVLTQCWYSSGVLYTFYDEIIVAKNSSVPNTNSVSVVTDAYLQNGEVIVQRQSVDVPISDVIWNSHTEGGYTGSNILIMQNDGNLVIYDENNDPVWATGTN